MEQLKEILSVGDELNLYLVVNGLKPASVICLNPLDLSLGTKVTKSEELRKKVRRV
jgi:hypothetical protein